MAIAPFDYTSGNGFGQGLQLAGLQQQVQLQRAAAEQAQQQQQAQQQFRSDWQAAYSSGDPAQLDALVAKYPGQIDTLKSAIGFKDDQHRAALGNTARDLRVAIQSGNPQAIAAAAQKNAGTLASVGSSPEDVLTQFQNDPQSLMHTIDAVGMGALGPKDYYDFQDKSANRQVTMRGQDLSAETARRGQDISAATAQRGQNLSYGSAMAGHNLASQRLTLDQQEFAFKQDQAAQKKQELITGAPKLSVNMEKGISQAVDDSTASTNSANSMSSLADQFLKENPTTGIFGNANNMFSRLTGSDTALRDLRIRQNALINSQVLKFLPPGPATDRDVEIVRQGAPTDMDNPKIVARWLSSMANMERRNAQFNDFKAEWMSANGNPGQSRNGGQILGMDVNKGESLGQAAKRYMAQNPIGSSPAPSATGSMQPAQTSTRTGETYTSKSGIKFKVE